MFAGHFGVAAAAKARAPELPLWTLMLGTQAYDLVFLPLQIAGIESITGKGYGQAVITAFYSHSLLAAVLLAALLGWLGARRWGKRGGLVLGGVVFSHWLIDLLVHRPDLPLLPGNAGALPLMGFSLWSYPAASLIVEALLLIGGALLYGRYVMRQAKHTGRSRSRALGAVTAMSLFLAAMMAVNFL